MCKAIDKFSLYAFRLSKMASWNQPASKDTFALQYTAFSKDAFFSIDTSVSSKRLADDGFVLDFDAIEALRSLKFLPLNEADKIRAKDLNAIHAGLMGAVEKLMKVYALPGLPLIAPTTCQIGLRSWILI